MSSSHTTEKKKDQEQINTIQCLKLELTRLTSAQNQKQQGVLIKQLSTIPLALANPYGTPFLSSDKSQSIHFFKERYPSAFTQTIPRNPDWVFLELMVLLHIPPKAVHKKMEDWLQCLWHSQVKKWFHVASSVLCILADGPPEDPTHSMKYFERIQRGESANLSVPSRGRFDRNSACASLKDWELVLSNRESKRQLSELVGEYFLCKAREVPHSKILLISGCFEGDYKNQCLRVSSSEEQPEILTEYEFHHGETDTRFCFVLSRKNAKSSLLADGETRTRNPWITNPVL